jgi:hypothetical protein
MSEISSETTQKQTARAMAPSHADRTAAVDRAGSPREHGKLQSSSVVWRRALGNRAMGRLLQSKIETNQQAKYTERL